MRAAVATDLDRIAELVQKARSAAAAENWNLTIVTLRNASYDCLLISNTLTHIEPSGRVIDVREPLGRVIDVREPLGRVIDVSELGSPALWNWH